MLRNLAQVARLSTATQVTIQSAVAAVICNAHGGIQGFLRSAHGIVIDKTMTSEKRSLQQIVLEAEVPVLVLVSAQSCGPCAAMQPVLAALDERWGDGLHILKIDGRAHPQFMDEFSITGFPSLLLLQRGRLLWSRRGYTSLSMLEKMIRLHASE